MENTAPNPSICYRVFAALLALLLLTVGAAQLSLGPLGVAVALGVAIAKALLILLYFMQLRYRGAFARLVAATGFFWLGILFVLTLSDFVSRGWAHVAGK